METVKSVEEPVISKKKQNEYKLREFREYVADKNVVLAIVKFLVAIKNSKEPLENPLKALQDYFGSYRDSSWDDFENLQKTVSEMQAQNQDMLAEIQKIEQEIEQAKLDKQQKEEEERIRLEEESKKQTKKVGKK